MPQSRLRSFVRFNRYYGGEYLSTVYFSHRSRAGRNCRFQSRTWRSRPPNARTLPQAASAIQSMAPTAYLRGCRSQVGGVSSTKRYAAPCTTVCSRVMFLLCRGLYALLIVLSRRFETLATIADAMESSNQT